MNTQTVHQSSLRGGLFAVFFTALSVIYLESVLLQALLVVASYIESVMAIPLALLGLAIGGLAVFIFRSKLKSTPLTIGLLLVAFAISFYGAYFSVCYFSSAILSFPFLLLLPFALGSMILSIFFIEAPSSKVYAADLVGAGIGAVIAAVAIETIGTESAFIGGTVLIAICGVGYMLMEKRRFSVMLVLFVLIGGFGVGSIVYQHKTDRLNFVRLARVQKDGSSINTGYALLKKNNSKELIYSHSSLSGRIDAFATRTKQPNQKIRWCMLTHDGYPSDSIKFKPIERYTLDPRVPWGFIKDPDSFIIGTSAEGVIKAVKGMGDGKVVGVELANGKVDFMLNGLGKILTEDAYQYIDEFERIDARSYLNIYPDKKFDHITMMNTHMGIRIKRSTAPEYLHTVDAFLSYFDHLTDRGFVNIEETSSTARPDDDHKIKLAGTIVEALKRYGVEDPGKNIFIFRWGEYMQYFVKKTPFSAEELDWLDKWVDKMNHNRKRNPFVVVTSVIWHPAKTINGPIASMIRLNGDYTRPGKNYVYTTDDRPFMFDVLADKPVMKQALSIILKLAVFLVLIPAFILLFVVLKTKPLPGISMIFYFGLLGLAFLFVEIILIQRSQMFLGSPVTSAITMLGSMLVFSGFGSLYSAKFANTRKKIWLVFALIIALAITLAYTGPFMFKAAASFPLWARIAVSVASVAPLAFFMGMPFPVGLTISKGKTDDRAGALMFSVNGALSAVATPVSFYLSTSFGFQNTLLIGTGIYLLLAVFLSFFSK